MTVIMTAPGGDMLLRPEDAFVIRPDAPAGIPIDAIECAAARADAILTVLMTQFETTEQCTLSNNVVCNTLWAVQGLIEEIRILANNKEIEIK